MHQAIWQPFILSKITPAHDHHHHLTQSAIKTTEFNPESSNTRLVHSKIDFPSATRHLAPSTNVKTLAAPPLHSMFSASVG